MVNKRPCQHVMCDPDECFVRPDPVAHPPQPSETVAEAARVLINAYSRDDNLGRTLVRLAGEAQKYSPAAEAFLLEVSALRALKGGSVND